ncbi:PREDICTED: uncharacterized protein LOC109480907 isoform X3 [Branchiostoma belcheri]|uniref:Uncharacterized protein LOC109480907 isoform X3 n=1 Tax=Branchiostoma belcheri TaxID=7741 RepID=A0A6P5AAM1_BRABE|nr:PREDICTED: uncharacterized protein LOC109480907 isoform X3 [Branchiostoma belcheri]
MPSEWWVRRKASQERQDSEEMSGRSPTGGPGACVSNPWNPRAAPSTPRTGTTTASIITLDVRPGGSAGSEGPPATPDLPAMAPQQRKRASEKQKLTLRPLALERGNAATSFSRFLERHKFEYTTSPSSNHFNREELTPQRPDRNLSTSTTTTSSHDFRTLEEREDRPIGSQYGIPRIDQDRALRADEKSKDGAKWNAFKPTWERNAGIHSSSYILRDTVPAPHTQINGISLSRNSNTGMGLGRGDELPLALGALSLSSPVRRRESSPKAPPKWKLESKTSLSAPAGQRSKYPDPVSGAPTNFQQRLAELSVLEQDTIRYERTKKSKRKAKQDRDS